MVTTESPGRQDSGVFPTLAQDYQFGREPKVLMIQAILITHHLAHVIDGSVAHRIVFLPGDAVPGGVDIELVPSFLESVVVFLQETEGDWKASKGTVYVCIIGWMCPGRPS